MRMRSHGSGLHGEHTAMTRPTRSARCINGRQRSVARDVRSRRVQKRGRKPNTRPPTHLTRLSFRPTASLAAFFYT